MIDDSDADFTLLASTGVGGWLGLIMMLAALCLYWVACENKQECAQKHCDVGRPVLAHHECVCETLAK